MREPKNQKTWIKYLRGQGWEVSGSPGNHQVKMTKPGHRPIPLPMHKGQDYGKGLTAKLHREVQASRLDDSSDL